MKTKNYHHLHSINILMSGNPLFNKEVLEEEKKVRLLIENIIHI